MDFLCNYLLNDIRSLWSRMIYPDGYDISCGYDIRCAYEGNGYYIIFALGQIYHAATADISYRASGISFQIKTKIQAIFYSNDIRFLRDLRYMPAAHSVCPVWREGDLYRVHFCEHIDEKYLTKAEGCHNISI